jgi:hypothetical protein
MLSSCLCLSHALWWVKPMGRGNCKNLGGYLGWTFPRPRDLAQAHSWIWTCFYWECPPPMVFTHHNVWGELYNEPKHMWSRWQGVGVLRFLHPCKNGKDVTMLSLHIGITSLPLSRSRCKIPLLSFQGEIFEYVLCSQITLGIFSEMLYI